MEPVEASDDWQVIEPANEAVAKLDADDWQKIAKDSPKLVDEIGSPCGWLSKEDASVFTRTELDKELGDIIAEPVVMCNRQWPDWFLGFDIEKRCLCCCPASFIDALQPFWTIAKVEENGVMNYTLSPKEHPEWMIIVNGGSVTIGKAMETTSAYWFVHAQNDGSFALHPKLNSSKHLIIHQSKLSDSKTARLGRDTPTLAGTFWITDAKTALNREWSCTVNMAPNLSTNIPHRLNTSWLAKVPDNICLSQLWIPGTHDTCSFPHHSFGIVDTINRTQSFSIPSQLAAGIRFLDIRLRHAKNSLYVHHGLVYLHENWTGVLSKCLDFLKENPSEFVIIKIQMEYKPEGNTNTTWGGLVLQGLEDVPKEKLWTSAEMPTVGEARGKIVLTTWSPKTRPKYPDLGFIPWGGEKLEDEAKYIQDLYDGPSVSTKWKEFMALWARSHMEKNPKTFFVNHATASGLRPGTAPKDYSKALHTL